MAEPAEKQQQDVQPEGGDDAQQQEPDLGAALANMQAKLDELTAKQEPEPEPEPKKEPPKPAKPPERKGRLSTDDYDKLAAFATSQAQEAYAYKLGHNMGVDPEVLLEGNYSRPEDMLAAAERMADRRAEEEKIKALEEKIQALEARSAQAPGGGDEEPAPASVDAGGPTSVQSDAERELEQRYATAKASGKTRDGRLRLLEAIYRDPRKMVRGQKEHVT